jgi:polar amino acid transport system substrate-binding protein
LMALLVVAAGCQSAPAKPSTTAPKAPPAAARPASPAGPKRSETKPAATSVNPLAKSDLPTVAGSEYWRRVRGGRLRVAIPKDTPPFAMRVAGQLTGFDVELARHLCATLGVKLELIELPVDDVLPSVFGPKPIADLALANITRTSRRAARVNFSAPYLTVSQAAIVERRLVAGESQPGGEIEQRSFESYEDLARLSALVVGVRDNSAPERFARRSFPTARLKSYPTLAEAFVALRKGRVQAVAHDEPAIRLWNRQNAGLNYRFKALLRPVTEDPICIAIRKGDLEFLRWLDVYVAEVEAEGLLARLRRRFIEKMTWLDD